MSIWTEPIFVVYINTMKMNVMYSIQCHIYIQYCPQFDNKISRTKLLWHLFEHFHTLSELKSNNYCFSIGTLENVLGVWLFCEKFIAWLNKWFSLKWLYFCVRLNYNCSAAVLSLGFIGIMLPFFLTKTYCNRIQINMWKYY